MSLTHEKVGSLPVVNWFLERLGLTEILERYVPSDDVRLRLAPASVIELVVRNIILSHELRWANRAAPTSRSNPGWGLTT